jgi:hypothetical protein
MLEEYSKGKVLTIKTHRKKKVKNQKKQKRQQFYGDVDVDELERQKRKNEEDMDADYNPQKPEEIDQRVDELVYEFEEDEDEAGMYYSGSEDDDAEEVNVERNFIFVSEISTFVDYNVVSKYMLLLKDKDYEKNHELLLATNKFFSTIRRKCTRAGFRHRQRLGSTARRGY